MRLVIFLSVVLGLAGSAFAQEYDILLKGGHVLDARNAVSAVRDVAIKDGKIAAVAENIPAAPCGLVGSGPLTYNSSSLTAETSALAAA